MTVFSVKCAGRLGYACIKKKNLDLYVFQKTDSNLS